MRDTYFRHLRQNLHLIVVSPLKAGNCGSIARIMKNFGVRHLRAVTPCNLLDLAAKRMAMNSYELLTGALVCDTFDEAAADLQVLFATSARVGRKRISRYTPKTAADRIIELLPHHRVGIIFGPEDTGLDNAIVAKAQNLISVPTSDDLTSLNLAQSVAVILSEIFAQICERNPVVVESEPDPGSALAPRQSLEYMFKQINDVLFEIGYLDPQNPQRMMIALRDIFERSQLTERDVRILRGIFNRMLHFRKHGKPAPKRNDPKPEPL